MDETLIAGFCDCHMHIVGPTDKFPQIANRSYTAGPASVASLVAAGRSEGVTRFVAVQPSFYGTDNSCMMRALEELGDFGRGVAVVEPLRTSANALEDYGRRGICGLRLNLYSFALADVRSHLERSLGDALNILPRPGWHIEIIAGIQTLVATAPILANAGVPIVIDHYGLPDDHTPDSAVGRTLLDLAALPHIWVKLTAPYRCSQNPVETSPPDDWLRAFLRTAPDRCVWGSDWPHTPIRNHAQAGDSLLPYRNMAYGKLFSDFVKGLPTPDIARRVLIENPTRLYGFPSSNNSRTPRGVKGIAPK